MVGGANSPDPTRPYDRTTSKFMVKNFGSKEPGFEVIPAWPRSVVHGIRVYTSSDTTDRDPASFILRGRNSASEDWQLIADGDLALPSARNAHTLPLTPDMAHDEAMFENTVSHSQYRVTFPTVKKSGSDMVVSQVELPGLLLCSAAGAICAHSTHCCSGECLGSGLCSA